MTWGETLTEFAFLLIAVVALLTFGCGGTEPLPPVYEAPPPHEQVNTPPPAPPVAAYERCFVTIRLDGSVGCKCFSMQPEEEADK